MFGTITLGQPWVTLTGLLVLTSSVMLLATALLLRIGAGSSLARGDAQPFAGSFARWVVKILSGIYLWRAITLFQQDATNLSVTITAGATAAAMTCAAWLLLRQRRRMTGR